MKLKCQFVISEMLDELIATPIGNQEVIFNAVIKLNETSAFILNQLNNDITYDVLVKNIAEKFNCDLDYAKENADAVIKSLKENDLITE